ncbi:MAG: ESPR domain-containing protein [Azonexus sp.]|nr:ESPR domain-containing protein [Azonexus sp.]
MNHTYKTIFNRTSGVWQAVAETATGQGKSKSVKNTPPPPPKVTTMTVLPGH